MNKKIFFLILSIIIVLGITFCGGKDNTKVLSEQSSESSADNYGLWILRDGNDIGTFSYDGHLRYIGKWGAILGDPTKFKNTTETEVKTKDNAIELAKNELLSEITVEGVTIKFPTEYDDIYVYYDESSSMWAVIFTNGWFGGQKIIMDSKGITKLIECSE